MCKLDLVKGEEEEREDRRVEEIGEKEKVNDNSQTCNLHLWQ